MDEETREALDDADPEAVRQALIDVLREGDGAKLRSLLRALQANDDPDAKRLYATLIRQPALSDLLPH